MPASLPDHPPAAAPLDKRDWIAGLEKGLTLIETFDDANPRQTASQAGQRCGLTRTAARRYLLTLAHLGYVATDGKQFWLTPRILRLGHSYLDSARLPRIAQPYLQRVTSGTQEAAYVSVLDGDETVYIARNSPNRTMNAGFGLGARVPAQVTAAGMLMLAMRAPEVNEAWLDAGVAQALHQLHHHEQGTAARRVRPHSRPGLVDLGAADGPGLPRHRRAAAGPRRCGGGRAERVHAHGPRVE